MNIFYPPVWLVKKSRVLSALAMRVVKLTGKSRYAIHPKHLISIEKPWYLAKINKNDIVLDLGCNNGQHSLKIAKHCRKIVGLDYDQQQLNIATASAKDKKITNAQFKKQDLEQKLPLKSNSIDKIIFLDVLEHLVKRQQILREISRVLKPKGLLFLAVPNVETSWKKLQQQVGLNCYGDPDHKIEYTKTSISQELTKAGLKIVDSKPVVFDTPWVGFIDLLGGFSLSLYAQITKIKKQKAKNNPQESTGFRIVASHR